MSVTVPESPQVIRARDLTVELNGLPVLRGVSLTVRAGESVCLLGGNGSGKSTLVRALLGLVPTVRGSVRLFDTPLKAFRQWRRVGYVPQRTTAITSGATVAEVVGSGLVATRQLFLPQRRRQRAAVAEALELVGMAGRARHDVRELSGGQQQRVLIARALVGKPDLLVLDEPTAGVDLEHRQALAQLLRTRLGEGAAVLVVLHELGELADLIDRAVGLRDGRVVHDGDPAALPVSGPGAGRHEHEEPTVSRGPGLTGAVGS